MTWEIIALPQYKIVTREIITLPTHYLNETREIITLISEYQIVTREIITLPTQYLIKTREIIYNYSPL